MYSKCKIILFLGFVILLFSCASVSYTDKHQLVSEIQTLDKKTYVSKKDSQLLLKHDILHFTKNGRVKSSISLDNNNDTLVTTKKKLWFTKQSYPDKDPYYCKTRWKPKNRERISCYTQKQYKKNEAIYYYHKNGSINKIEDNFSNFYTKHYTYKNNDVSKITIVNKANDTIEVIKINCLKKDTSGTCLEEVQTYTQTDSVITIYRYPKYF
ncbi:hypothetical protein [Corallibacter sp.]|uniref:hypothetical protein n=1 Tax=Corallibacter sp. TaxID=2038084 RepID=UPI003AB3298E